MGIQLLPASGCKKFGKHADKSYQEAKRWGEYVTSLRRVVNSMYETCVSTQNLLACEEAHMYLMNAARDFEALISSINVELEWENPGSRPHTIAWEVKGANHNTRLHLKDLNGCSSVARKVAIADRQLVGFEMAENCENTGPQNKAMSNIDVYERLAYSKRCNSKHSLLPSETSRFSSCRVTTPRSVMDIPQTKSSMAKIAYSRQLLWQRHKKILTEKLVAKRRREHTRAIENRRRSLPAQSMSALPTATRNLESINEAHEDDRRDDSSVKTHAGRLTTRSDPHGCRVPLLDMSSDEEWKALTEEEESLAQEEESLKKEIEEEESISVDEEFQRRVILDFSDLMETESSRQGWKNVVDEWRVLENNLHTEQLELKPELRRPGAAAEVHQKLRSPLRRRNVNVEDISKRLSRAEELRLMVQEQKSQRLRELLSKVEEVRRKRDELLHKKREHLEGKMERAANNRQKNLDERVKKARDDDLRVMEVNFINEMEAENAKFDIQMKEHDREQRLHSLAQEKAQLALDKADREAKLKERRRTADERRLEQLKKQSTRQKERQVHAEVQRSEIFQSFREKARLREQKLEERKANQLNSHEKAKELYVASVENVRQRAAESNSRAGLSIWMHLSDCSAPPSDIPYTAAADSLSIRRCTACDLNLFNDLELVGHILSPSHLSVRKKDVGTLCFSFLNTELEECIIHNFRDEIINTEQPMETIDGDWNSETWDEIKTEILKCNDSTTKQCHTGGSFGLKNPQKINAIDLINQTRRWQRDPSEKNRSLLERSMLSTLRLVTKGTEFSPDIYFDSLYDVVNAFSNSTPKLSSKLFHLIWEVCNAATPEAGEKLLISKTYIALLDFLQARAEKCIPERDVLLIYGIITSILKKLDPKRLNLTPMIELTARSLPAVKFRQVFNYYVQNPSDVELGFSKSWNPLAQLTDFLQVLATLTQSTTTYMICSSSVQCLLLEVYSKIRSESISAASSGVMSNSMTSSISSFGAGIVGSYTECCCLVRLWNSLSLLANDDILDMAMSIRFVYIIASVLQCFGARLTFDGESDSILSVKDILNAVASFSAISLSHQMLCLLGWQRSIAVQLCRLPFELIQDQHARRYLMATLVLILRCNIEGVRLTSPHLSVTWLLSFLKEECSNGSNAFCENPIYLYMSLADITDAINFFSHAEL